MAHSKDITIGVLALQGDFKEHISVFTSLGASSIEVRSVDDLALTNALVIPGGESTVISKLLTLSGLRDAIINRYNKGNIAIFGTCAGAILLAKNIVDSSTVKSLEIMDISIERNAYGRQSQSFRKEITLDDINKRIPVSFVRAPKIVSVGNDVLVLASLNDDPILVRQNNLLASTFHTEVTGVSDIHDIFLEMCAEL